ncbi:MAG TPA: carboxylesterase family protein [Steroidobacteraceae bacterium]|nr:carboxylesterase family protein [Steroidobacteraceae bacterium]
MTAAMAGGLGLVLPAGLLAAAPERAAPPDQSTSPVETTSGRVRGLRSGGVSRFLGIAYGDDTAKHRFQPPRPPQPWTGVRDCFTPGAQAPQGPITISGATGMSLDGPGVPIIMAVRRATTAHVPESEDCLYLNVFTPEPSHAGKRAVMVWLHGGGFAMGAGLNSMTDGSELARRGDVVVVSLNHRLNAMGYLYLGALHEDFADSGNVGQLDIVLALQWVRDNIAAFGGDPANVTIFGESGGGSKVGTMLGMLPAQGLFHRAIEQSGPAVRLVDRADAAMIAEQTLAALGVARADVHKLQTMDRTAVIAAASAVKLHSGMPGLTRRTLAPVVDGRSIPAHPFDPAATDISRNVPLMIGTTKDEWTLFMAADGEFGKIGVDEARRRFAAIAGERGAAAFEVYRSARPADPPTYWISSLLTDLMMRTDSIVEADRKSAQNAAPVFMYRVDYEPRVMDRLLRSPHGTDVPLMFGTLVPPEMIGSGSEVQELCATMMQAWVNFARAGSPAQRSLAWPRYETRRRSTMIFDAPSRVASDPDRVTREFWAA